MRTINFRVVPYNGMKVLLACALAWALLVASCGDDEPEQEATPAPTSDVAAVDLSAASPFAATIADAFSTGDYDKVRVAVRTQQLPCVASDQTSTSGPPCQGGDPVGTVYETLWIAGCQPGWALDIEEVVRGWLARAGDPYALARVPPRPDTMAERSAIRGTGAGVFTTSGSGIQPSSSHLYQRGRHRARPERLPTR